ncbi:MAG: SLC13 family permease, partial [Fulvivirga sp.]|nr:SLC13 family permease [Fulvivirga sp.]
AIATFQTAHPVVILAGLMVVTTLLTSFITNVGAVAIAFPLALALSTDLNLDGAPFYLAIAFSASAAFLTPIGYQTNLIIYGPGGYNFKDFLKIGVPTTLVYLSVSLVMICLLYSEVLLG